MAQVSDALAVHVGEQSPEWWDEVEQIRQAGNPRAGGDAPRPLITSPDIDWEALGLTPRWVGDDASEAIAALEPSRFHGRGADEWERFLRGTASRDETALAVTLIGDDSPPVYRAQGSPWAGVTIPYGSGQISTSVGGEWMKLSSPPEPPSDLRGADRNLAMRIATRSLDLPWWSLGLSAQLLVREQFMVHPKPSGHLSPLLKSRAGEVVAAVWSSPDQRVRHYVLPFLPSYVPVLEWLADFAIPEFVPSAARRRRSSLSLDPPSR